MVLWRGMKDMSLSERFLREGGTELACMSTTDDVQTALEYAGVHVAKKAQGKDEAAAVQWPLIMKVQVPDFMSSGADISWLSAFPDEKEYLYPPLTFLRVVTTARSGGVTMALVAPSYPT